MRPSLVLLLLLLLSLCLGSTSTTVGCGTVGVGGVATIGCSRGGDEDPCDYVVTIRATVLLDADGRPLNGVTVTIDSGPPDPVNTRITDATGRVFWPDTSFLTGFSANCDGQNVGTVEPYSAETSFLYTVLFSSPGLSPLSTTITIDRGTRDLELTVRMAP